jgi:hypothetical protein
VFLLFPSHHENPMTIWRHFGVLTLALFSLHSGVITKDPFHILFSLLGNGFVLPAAAHGVVVSTHSPNMVDGHWGNCEFTCSPFAYCFLVTMRLLQFPLSAAILRCSHLFTLLHFLGMV